jgi:hypothetical protein
MSRSARKVRQSERTERERPERRRLDVVLDAVEACLWLVLLAVGSLVALEVFRAEAGPARARGAKELAAPSGVIEAESLRVIATSRAFTFWLQPTVDFPTGRWSKDGQMFAYRTQRGDWIDLELPQLEPGAYRLELLLTRSADYGVVAVSVNGNRVGAEIDLWSGFEGGVSPTGPLELGVVQLDGRSDVLRLAVVGTNPESDAPHYQFGIDGIRLSRYDPPKSAGG